MTRNRFVLSAGIALALSLALAAETPPRIYVVQTVAGSDFAGDGGPAVAAAFSQTEGVAVDGAGNIFLADAGGHRVRKITPDGTIQTVAGTGVAGFAGDGGAANRAALNQPYGIALDGARNLYIADLGNARVRKVSPDGTIRTVAGGGALVPGGDNDGSPATSAQLMQPRNVAVQPDGTFYVSDFGANCIYSVSPNGTLTTLAGNGNAGLSGDGAAAPLAQLKSPAGLAVDVNGVLYIADSGNNRVRKVFRGVISTVYIIAGPTGLAISPSGSLYIASTAYVGTQYRALTGIPSARDIAADAAGNLYASTGTQLRKIGADGKVATIAGSAGSPFFGGDNGPAANARLHAPSGVAMDASGNLYVADTANHRVRMITPGGVITTIAGTGEPGLKGDNGPAKDAQLNEPRAVAVDSQRTVYIADRGNNRIRKIMPGGTIAPFVTQLNAPEAIALDGAGNLYVADTGNNRVLRVNTSGSATTLTQVLKPTGVTVDALGNVYVSELSRISRIAPGAGPGTVLDGLTAPRGLAAGADGSLFIVESGLNAIRRITPSGALETIGGTGTAGFAGDGGPAVNAQFNTPTDLVVDLSGTIYLADAGNNRVRSLTPTVVAEIVTPMLVVNSATMMPGPIAPGEIVTVFGLGFEPEQTQLLFDDRPATIFYTGATQINGLAPADLKPNSSTGISVMVKGARAGAVSAAVVSAAPGLFTMVNGTGQAAAVNEDGGINAADNPAARGSIVSLYGTGEGADVSAVSVKIGGYAAEILYAGPAPGLPGLLQVNTRVPAGFAPAGILPVVLSVGKAVTQAGVTIAVR